LPFAICRCLSDIAHFHSGAIVAVLKNKSTTSDTTYFDREATDRWYDRAKEASVEPQTTDNGILFSAAAELLSAIVLKHCHCYSR